mgnify:CR=1 FL=1
MQLATNIRLYFIFVVETNARLLSNEMIKEPVNSLLNKIAYPKAFVPQDTIKGKIGVVTTPKLVWHLPSG